MTDSVHTPLPWWIDDDGFIAAGSGDDYQTVADPHCRPTVDYGDENGANADFIINACNNYYQLLETLKKIADLDNRYRPAFVKEIARSAITRTVRPQ
jgi:hypothetical protein